MVVLYHVLGKLSASGLLTLRLKERGFVQKRMGHSRTRTWLGIALEPYEEPMDEETLRRMDELYEQFTKEDKKSESET